MPPRFRKRSRIEPGYATLEDTAAALSVARAAANSMRLQESPKGHLQPLSLPRPQPGRAILQSDQAMSSGGDALRQACRQLPSLRPARFNQAMAPL